MLILLCASQSVRLKVTDLYTFGRNTPGLRDPDLSRQHFQIRTGPKEAYYLVDLGSKNGTQLNGKRVTKKMGYPLGVGDKITAGGLIFEVIEVSAPEATPPKKHPLLMVAIVLILIGAGLVLIL